MTGLRSAPIIAIVFASLGVILAPTGLSAQASTQGESEGTCEVCNTYGTCDTRCDDAFVSGWLLCDAYPCLGGCTTGWECYVSAISPDGSAVDPDAIPASGLTLVHLASPGTTDLHLRRQCDGSITQRAYAPGRVHEIHDAMVTINLEG